MPDLDEQESMFLQGAFAPVLGERTVTRLPVTGRLPAELDGLFTQIGPNPIKPPTRRGNTEYSWFSQDGMVSGVRLSDGDALWFRNRWVRSRRVRRTLREPRPPGPRHFFNDTVHTNVVYHGGLLLGLVEAGCVPVRLSEELDTLGYTDLGGTLPRGFAAHPKLDPATGELVAIAYSPLRTTADYLVVDPAGRVRTRERVRLGGRPMVHDIALTPGHVVFLDLPVRFHLPGAVTGGMPFRWDRRHQARLGLLPRTGKGLRWFDIEPCFAFHFVGAHEDGDRVVLRGLRYGRAFEGLAAGPITEGAVLWEWSVDTRTGRVAERQVDDFVQELPRTDPRLSGRAARYHYAVSGDIVNRTPDALLKHDHHTGTTQVRAAGGVPSEPVFVPGGPGEDEGWLLYFHWLPEQDRTDLVVLPAGDVTGEPVATVHLPFRVPFGFHASWITAAELRSAAG